MSEFRRRLMIANQKKEQYIKITLAPTAKAYLQFPDNPDLIAVANKPVRFTWDITSSNKWNRYTWTVVDLDTNERLLMISDFGSAGTGEAYLTLSKDTYIGLTSV